jgi:hypothetical protein
MNTILGNRDRHMNNWMHSADGLKMIDHGHAFDMDGQWPTPSYWHAYHYAENPSAYKSVDPMRRPLHPAAVAWAKSLDPAKLNEMFERHHAPADFSHRPLKRLQALREALEHAPQTRLDQLLALIR